MKSLSHLKSFEISKESQKSIHGGGSCIVYRACKKTAERDGNDFLVPLCESMFDPTHSCQ